MLLFLLVVRHHRQVNHFSFDVLGNLFDLELPEVGRFNLELASGHRYDAVLR